MLQILVVYLVQHAMLVGLTLPFRYIASSTAAWSLVDTGALVLALGALALATQADNSLHKHVAQNAQRSEVLCTGAWALCRHPNHFAEALFWWATWLFAVPCGGAWTVVGTAFNSACMIQVRCRPMQPWAGREAAPCCAAIPGLCSLDGCVRRLAPRRLAKQPSDRTAVQLVGACAALLHRRLPCRSCS